MLHTVAGAALIVLGVAAGFADFAGLVEQTSILIGFGHSQYSLTDNIETEVILLVFLVPAVLLIRYGARLADTPDARWRLGRRTEPALTAMHSERLHAADSRGHHRHHRHHR